MARKHDDGDRVSLEEGIRRAALGEGFGLERKAAKTLYESGFHAQLGTIYLDLEEDERGRHVWRERDIRAVPNLYNSALLERLVVSVECKHVKEDSSWVFVLDPIPPLHGSSPPFVTTDDQRLLACEPPLGIEESSPYFAGHPVFMHAARATQHFVLRKEGKDDPIRGAMFQAIKPSWYELHRQAFHPELQKQRLFVMCYVVVSKKLATVTYVDNYNDVNVNLTDRVLVTFERPIAQMESLLLRREPPKIDMSLLTATSVRQRIEADAESRRRQWLTGYRRCCVEFVTLDGLRESASQLRDWYANLATTT